MPTFIPGLALAERFYREAVRPILEDEFAGLSYSAALIGPGSEVLGFDTPQSTDHHWGPRVMLFLAEDDWARERDRLIETLANRLPPRFQGYSTHFVEKTDEPGTMLLHDAPDGPIRHRVEVLTLRQFVRDMLDVDLDGELTAVDWLTFPQQKLRGLIEGGVFHDPNGQLEALRRRFAFYPRDVWIYMLACGWERIGQEEAFVGRTGAVGDETGSRVIAARLVRDLMRLCFLMERVYTPYPKWFGTAFSRLACAPALTPIFHRVLAAVTWRERERHLSEAYGIVAKMHNNLGLTEPMPMTVTPYHNRPYMVIHGDRFADALLAVIEDDEVRRIAARTRIGSIDQFSDNTDLLEKARLREPLKALYA